MAAELTGKEYSGLIAPGYNWEVWATPKDAFGKLD